MAPPGYTPLDPQTSGNAPEYYYNQHHGSQVLPRILVDCDGNVTAFREVAIESPHRVSADSMVLEEALGARGQPYSVAIHNARQLANEIGVPEHMNGQRCPLRFSDSMPKTAVCLAIADVWL